MEALAFDGPGRLEAPGFHAWDRKLVRIRARASAVPPLNFDWALAPEKSILIPQA
jgi:hypothetical protein